MVRSLSSFVKQWLIPGSMPMLFIGTMVGAVLVNVRIGGFAPGRIWVTTLAATYWLLSLPAIANRLIRLLAARDETLAPPPRMGAGTLIVFGNGSVHYTDGRHAVDYLTRRSVFCVLEAVRLYASFEPDVVIATGGVAGHSDAQPESWLMRDLLVDFGVPPGRIVVEAASRTTEEQVTNVIALLAQRAVDSTPVVVTTSAHMRRVVSLFRQHGFRVESATTPELRYDEGRDGWRRWWPSMSALTGSASAAYEWLAGLQAHAGAALGGRRRNLRV